MFEASYNIIRSRLIHLQKRVIRSIDNAHFHSRTEPLFKTLTLLNLMILILISLSLIINDMYVFVYIHIV